MMSMKFLIKIPAILVILLLGILHSLSAQTTLVDRYIKSKVSTYKQISQEFDAKDLHQISDITALYNYFLSSRYHDYIHRNETPNRNKQQLILDRIKDIDNNSFEASFLVYKMNGYTEEGIQALKNAYAKDPTRQDAWDDMIGYYEITNDVSSARKLAQKIRSSGKYEQSIYDYNKNVVASTTGKSIVITQGELDTYPLLVLKYTTGLQDVVPISFKLLENEEYRRRILQSIGAVDTRFKNNRVNFEDKFSLDYLFNKRKNSVESNDLHRNYLPFLRIVERYAKDDDTKSRVRLMMNTITDRSN